MFDNDQETICDLSQVPFIAFPSFHLLEQGTPGAAALSGLRLPTSSTLANAKNISTNLDLAAWRRYCFEWQKVLAIQQQRKGKKPLLASLTKTIPTPESGL